MTASARRKIVKEIAAAIRKCRTFFLSGHQRPDGDTVASELAMASLLRRLGKRPEIYNTDPVPKSLSFLPGVGRVRTAQKVAKLYDAAVIFECHDADRMGNIIDLDVQAGCVVNIDHHLKHSHFGDVNLINPKASSNSEQLFYLFEEFGLPITKEEATCLYVGIVTDTGRFLHSNTNVETLRIASRLLERGADTLTVSEKIFGTRSLAGLKLLGYSLSNLKSSEGGRISHAALSEKDFARLGATHEETEEIVNYGLMPPAALVSILLYERNGGVKCSFRSRRGVDVCRLAQKFGGGGHKYAAGCNLDGPLGAVRSKVLNAARQILP